MQGLGCALGGLPALVSACMQGVGVESEELGEGFEVRGNEYSNQPVQAQELANAKKTAGKLWSF